MPWGHRPPLFIFNFAGSPEGSPASAMSLRGVASSGTWVAERPGGLGQVTPSVPRGLWGSRAPRPPCRRRCLTLSLLPCSARLTGKFAPNTNYFKTLSIITVNEMGFWAYCWISSLFLWQNWGCGSVITAVFFFFPFISFIKSFIISKIRFLAFVLYVSDSRVSVFVFNAACSHFIRLTVREERLHWLQLKAFSSLGWRSGSMA